MSFFKSLLTSFLLSTLVSAHPQHSKRQSSVPIGQIITSCTVPGNVALTFDDGPYIYTEHVLDLLKAGGHHATFFINGNNYASVYDYASTLQRMIVEGHQIGSHT
jgi:peptidoglycan/xylan/chitin deacetylase (PgdA/CDA1 family)